MRRPIFVVVMVVVVAVVVVVVVVFVVVVVVVATIVRNELALNLINAQNRCQSANHKESRN